MIKKCFLLIVVIFSASAITHAQKDSVNFGIKFSGFVNGQAYYDSRQTVNSREAQLLLYPDSVYKDKSGKDLNAVPSMNQVAMMTRLKGDVWGPNAFKAKSSAVIEADFTGPSNIENNAFRLRHAYVKLDWGKTKLLMGQYWHPFSLPEMLPDLQSLNTGAPFHPFARQPQIRLDHRIKNLNFVISVSSERDYVSEGPAGSSSVYLRNAVVPSTNVQIQYLKDDNIFGIAGDFKMLRPRTKSSLGYKVDEKIESYSGSAFAKMKLKKISVKIQGVVGQNLSDFLMIGGYGVRAFSDSLIDERTYTTINVTSGWVDIATNGKKLQVGIFGGYLKNLGSLYNIRGDYYTKGKDIAYLYRVSPRVVFCSGKVRIASEVEYTVAAYGKPNSLADVKDAKEVYNIRILLGIYYYF
ncbi:MAG: hypothetical protein PHD97_10600 [Bacteroidales bacterium]|nr:hypothetical protein [Bacteroidales bacterium]